MDPYLGTIELFALSYAPKGWMKCEGQLLEVSKYTMLFSLLGTRFGGDGMSTFGLPNLKEKEPVKDTSYCIAVEGVYPPKT